MNQIIFFKQKCIVFNWQTLFVGRDLGLISAKQIYEFAVEILLESNQQSHNSIILLAGDPRESEIDILLADILEKDNQIFDHNSDSYKVEKRKWRFYTLSMLRQNEYNNEQLLMRISEVYADLDYPQDMVEFIYYMPAQSDSVTCYSIEENRARLVNLFDIFLKKEEQDLRNN